MTFPEIKQLVDQIGGWVTVWVCAYCVLGPTKQFIVREIKDLTK